MPAGGPLLTAAPMLGTAVRVLLAGYLAYLAWRLWRVGAPAALRNDVPVVRKDVFLTTLLNPKAFVFALAIFPPPEGAADFGVHAAVFALTVATVAIGWIMVGAGLRRNLPRRAEPRTLARASAIPVAVFAGTLAGTAVAAFV
jgi:threonine/homoserine/homoserine lactone efflux protein